MVIIVPLNSLVFTNSKIMINTKQQVYLPNRYVNNLIVCCPIILILMCYLFLGLELPLTQKKEAGLLAYTATKCKCRNRLNVELDLNISCSCHKLNQTLLYFLKTTKVTLVIRFLDSFFTFKAVFCIAIFFLLYF